MNIKSVAEFNAMVDEFDRKIQKAKARLEAYGGLQPTFRHMPMATPCRLANAVHAVIWRRSVPTIDLTDPQSRADALFRWMYCQG